MISLKVQPLLKRTTIKRLFKKGKQGKTDLGCIVESLPTNASKSRASSKFPFLTHLQQDRNKRNCYHLKNSCKGYFKSETRILLLLWPLLISLLSTHKTSSKVNYYLNLKENIDTFVKHVCVHKLRNFKQVKQSTVICEQCLVHLPLFQNLFC